MFKNKTAEGRNNICGENLYYLRKNYPTKTSQRALAEQMQLRGIDVDKNAIQRMECGKRFITDIEIVTLAQIFDVSCDDLLTKNLFE